MTIPSAPGAMRLTHADAASIARMRARHPEAFHAPPLRRAAPYLIVALATALAVFALWRFEFSLVRLATGLARLGDMAVLMVPPWPGGLAQAWTVVKALGETVAIAFLGTLLATAFAFPVAFLAARNTTFSGVARFLTRRGLDGVRGVDMLIWALLWINVVGLGPFAGVLAVMTSDFGALGKLFSEAIEAADRKPVEGVASTGGSHWRQVRFGVLPQVLPVIAGQALYFFESNTRSSAIIGIVGAGGIGLYLSEQIRMFEWQGVAFAIILILIAVAIIDRISGVLRAAIINGGVQKL